MSLTINTNLTALTAQRNLGMSASKSASSLAKLSSGSRVPSAKDDAASLAVGSKLRAEVNALKQASLNTTQAVSMLQIADGAMSTIGDMLSRMKSLATQSSSGQLSDTERSLLHEEFGSLRNEITRIANDTDFNGTALLNGSEVVADIDEIVDGGLSAKGIKLDVDTAETSDQDTFQVTIASGELVTVENVNTGETQTIDVTGRIDAIATRDGDASGTDLEADEQPVQVGFDALGVTLTFDQNFDRSETVEIAANTDISSFYNTGNTNSIAGGTIAATVDIEGLGRDEAMTNLRGLNANTFSIGGTDNVKQFDETTGLLTLKVVVDDSGDSDDGLEFAAAAGLNFHVNGVAKGNNTASGDITESTDAVVDIYLNDGTTDVAKLASIDISQITLAGDGAAEDNYVQFQLADVLAGVKESTGGATSFTYRVGTGDVTANDEITVSLNAVTDSALGINSLDISTEAGASTALDTLTSAINTVSSRRASIGASQSRLDFAGASISVAIENVAAAESSLMDVDVSSEMTEFTSKQVLMQAGISMLAQANQQPSLLLRLLN